MGWRLPGGAQLNDGRSNAVRLGRVSGGGVAGTGECCQQSRYAPHDRDGVAIFIYDMSIYYLWFSFFACSRLYGVRYKNVTKDVKKGCKRLLELWALLL